MNENHYKYLKAQYEELFKLRERSILNIGSRANSYLTFLGLLTTAFSLSLSEIFGCIFTYKILFLILCVGVIGYGIWVYDRMIKSYIQQQLYTRKLNFTRYYLLELFDIPINFVEMPLNYPDIERDVKPGFDEMGFFNEKFSKRGFIRIIQILNSVFSAGIFLYTMSEILSKIKSSKMMIITYNKSPISFWFYPVLIGFLIFWGHSLIHLNLLKDAENRWINHWSKTN